MSHQKFLSQRLETIRKSRAIDIQIKESLVQSAQAADLLLAPPDPREQHREAAYKQGLPDQNRREAQHGAANLDEVLQCGPGFGACQAM